MKCLILAAGYATRLYPLTENFPKPLLKVGEKAILDWLIDGVDSCGEIDEYIVISNHKFVDHFIAWAASKSAIITVLDDGTSTNEGRLGAVRDIQFAIKTQNIDDDILVIAGDNLLDFSLNDFIRYAKSRGTSCVMRYRETDIQRRRKSGVLLVDNNNLVLNMEEKPHKPKSEWCCPPFYYYTHSDALRIEECIADGCDTDAPGSYVAWLCERSPIYAMEMPGARYDIGTLESYKRILCRYKGIEL